MLKRVLLIALLAVIVLTATTVLDAPPPVVVDVGDHIDFIIVEEPAAEGQQYWCLDSTTGANDWFDCAGKAPPDCFIAKQFETVAEEPPFNAVFVTFYDGCGLSVSFGGPQARPFYVDESDDGYALWVAGQSVVVSREAAGATYGVNTLLAQVGNVQLHKLATGEFQVTVVGDGIWSEPGKTEKAIAETLLGLNEADLHGE